MIQPVRGAIDHSFAIGNRDSAPLIAESGQIRQASFAFRRLTLASNGSAMLQKRQENFRFFGVAQFPDAFLTELEAKSFELIQCLFHLDRIIGQHFRCGIDGRQAATNHDPGKPYLQVGERRFLECTRQLKSHQKIAGRANSAKQVILHRDDGRLASTSRERNMAKTEIPGVVNCQ